MGELDGLGYAPSMPAFATLQAALKQRERSVAIQVLSDSTGDGTSDWPYRLAQSLSALYPQWTVRHVLFSDATQAFGAATTLSTGAPEGCRYLDCSTGTSGRLLQPDTVNRPHISGVIDVRLNLALADWTPAASVTPVGKYGGAGNRSWYCGINTTGLPYFVYSTDGTAVTSMFGSALLAVTDNTASWVRWLFNPNDGSGNRTLKCYTSTDGAAWTQLGATTTTVGAVTLYDATARGYEVGSAGGGTTAGMRVYEVQIRNGDTGPNIVPALPDLWPPTATTSATYVGAPTLTIVNGSVSGQDISYLGDVTRLPKLTPDYGQCVAFLSTSHNEGLSIGLDWTSKYTTWRNAVAARLPGAALVALTQNPEKSDTSWYREHAQRRLGLLGLCNANNWPVIDTWQSFLDYGPWNPALMGDSVHPNALGSGVVRDYILSRLVAD